MIMELSVEEVRDFITTKMIIPFSELRLVPLRMKVSTAVEKYLKREPLTPSEARDLADYILTYAENLTLNVYLHLKIRDLREALAYREYTMSFLRKLRKLHRLCCKNPIRKHIELMIMLCLSQGIDPF